MVPLCAVVVPVVPRGALPVHHLQGLQASGQRGEGGGWVRLGGRLEDGQTDTGDRRTNHGDDESMKVVESEEK